MKKKFSILLFTLIGLSLNAQEAKYKDTIRIFIGPDKAYDSDINKMCMLVKRSKDQNYWHLLKYDIENFYPIEDNEYELEIIEKILEKPNEERYTYEYVLVKEISKTRVRNFDIGYDEKLKKPNTSTHIFTAEYMGISKVREMWGLYI